MENNEIIKSISELTEKRAITVRDIPEYVLIGEPEKEQDLFRKVVLLVDKSIKEIVWMDHYMKVLQWMHKPEKKGLFLTGPPGLLKTVIATMILPVYFNTKYNMILQPVDSINIENHYHHFNNSPVIIIDDVGVEPPINDFGIKREPFSALVDFCEKKSKILIITSNLGSEQLIARYGTRTVDRIDLLCKSVRFKGKSERN